MQTLKDILGAVLMDAIRAQHQVNQYTKNLTEQYSQSGAMANFKLPSASIGEIQLDFKYAILDGIEEKEEEDINEKEVRRTLIYVAKEAEELLLKSFVAKIQHSEVDYKSEYGFIDELTSNKDFKKHLGKRFMGVLWENKESLVNADKTLNEKMACNILLDSAVEQIIDHDEVAGLLAQSDVLRNEIREDFRRVLEKEMDDILRESAMPSFRRIQRFGSLNVEMDSAKLAELPEERINTMSIKISGTGQITVDK